MSKYNSITFLSFNEQAELRVAKEGKKHLGKRECVRKGNARTINGVLLSKDDNNEHGGKEKANMNMPHVRLYTYICVIHGNIRFYH